MKLMHEVLDAYLEEIKGTVKDIHPGLSLTAKKDALKKIVGLTNILLANNPLLEREV